MAIGAIMGQQKANPQLSNLSNNQQALYNIGAEVRQNNLINPFFLINQRGFSSSSDSGLTTVDMWKRNSNSVSASVVSNGIELTFSSSSRLQQFIENPSRFDNKTVTISCVVEDFSGGPNCNLHLRINNTYDEGRSVDITGNGLFSATFTLPSGITAMSFDLIGKSGSYTVVGTKFEIGDKQTLAKVSSSGEVEFIEQPDPLEILKCQRFLFVVDDNERLAASSLSGNRFSVTIPTPITMRTTPTVQDPGLLFVHNGANQFYSYEITDIVSKDNAIRLAISVTNATFPSGEICLIVPNGTMYFSAEL